MTVINQNSISGITSITAASGSVQIFNSDGSSGSLTDLAGINVSGVVTATRYRVSAGSTAAPAITPPDDTNTGIFFPSADTIAFGEGGVEAARFDSSGRFGLGTSSPSSLLHLSVATAASDGTKGVRITNPAGTAAMFECGSSNDSYVGTTSASDFSIRTNNTSRIYVTNGGLIGIGTANPIQTLDVNGGIGVNGAITCKSSGTARGYLGDVDGDTHMQIRSESGQISFKKTNTEFARFDTSSRFLLGTSNARTNAPGGTVGFLLEGTSSTNSQNRFTQFFYGEADTGGPYIGLAKHRSTSIGGNTIVNNGDELGGIYFQGSDGTNFKQGAHILAYVDGTPGTNDMPGRLVFSTTVDGGSSPTSRVLINRDGSTRVTARAGIDCFYSTTPTAAGTSVTVFRGGHSATDGSPGTGTDSFYVFANGNVQNTNGSYTTISDIKLKENIVDADSQWSDLKAIKIRKWNFKAETGNETHRQLGPIAQELEEVCPGLVFDTPDRDAEGNDLGTVTKGVNQSVLYMKAVKALQEAMDRIEQLEAKVAALEGA